MLFRSDYTTMQASLEQRVPLLDLELTPWAIALPDAAKVRGLSGKAAFREAFGPDLPRSVVERRKSGFRLPLGEWIQTDAALGAFVRDHLESPSARLRQWMSASDLKGLASAESLSTTGGAKLAWTALGLELWLNAVARVGSATRG